MTDWTLLLDVGNSRVKWAWARDGALMEDQGGALPHDRIGELANIDAPGAPDLALVASVAHDTVCEAVTAQVELRWACRVDRLHTAHACGDVVNGYQRPATLGVDRWLALLGARRRHGLPVVVADIGSATTLDALDQDGRHLGGWILPGPGLMREALRQRTALPEFSTADALPGPASDTRSAIASGILAAQLGALERFLAGLPESRDAPVVVLCGGGARSVRDAIMDLPQHLGPATIVADPWLVFEGMLKVMEDERRASRSGGNP